MPDTDLLKAIHDAICDPGPALRRAGYPLPTDNPDAEYEPPSSWQARAVMEVIGPWLAKHDPSVNCDCGPDYPPGTTEQCEYAVLSDAVIEAFNPAGDDVAQVAICISAVERAAAYVAGRNCQCTREMIGDGDQCERCAVLGQCGGKPVDR